MKRAIYPVVSCAVAGCGSVTRTIPPISDGCYNLETGVRRIEMLCGRHWRRVPMNLKRRRRALIRQWKRRVKIAGTSCFWQLPPGSLRRIAMVRIERLIRAVWKRCIRIAAGDDVALNGAVPVGLGEELRKLGL